MGIITMNPSNNGIPILTNRSFKKRVGPFFLNDFGRKYADKKKNKLIKNAAFTVKNFPSQFIDSPSIKYHHPPGP